MTHSQHFNAIRLNLAIMTVHIDRASRLVDEAMSARNQNAAVGALLELPDKLDALQSLFGAIIAIHRNSN